MCLNFKIYTPQKIVKKLLTLCGYNGEKILKKQVVDNSCGQGAILEQVVLNYIKIALKQNFSNEQTKKDLEQYIHGFDTDKEAVEICKEKLQTIARFYNLPEVEWDIKVVDYLSYEDNLKYDYIIGNPPYISYLDMKKEERHQLRRFQSCSFGKYDYYYAFIEKAVNDLNDNGKMAYIVPNSFLKNNSARRLREIIKPFITDIIDLSGYKVFDDVLVSTCIIKLKKTVSKNLNYSLPYKSLSKKICKDIIIDKYFYDCNDQVKNLKFGDCYNVFSSVATLLNEAFLLNGNENNINFNEEVIRIAAGPKILSSNKKQYVIFPYSYDEHNNLIRYDEPTFRNKFPSSYMHLIGYKDKLEKRDKDKNVKFYEYGRTQALTKLNQEKLLVSTLITKQVNVYMLDKYTIPYSGLVILPKHEEYTLELAVDILRSDDFLNYIENVAVSASGETKRISSKDIANYRIGE